MKDNASILRAIFLSFHKSDLGTRSKFSLTEEEISLLYLKLKEVFNLHEAFIISTCNRTEIYYYSDLDISDDLIKYLLTSKGLNNHSIFSKTTTHQESVERLFKVGIGLDSQILGDQQIIHQFKKAYQMACDADMAGVILHKLLHTLFYTNKRVINETKFGTGQASIAYVAAQLINSFQIPTPNVLVIGVGEFGKEVAKNLEAVSSARLTLTNRSSEKAEALAKIVNANTLPFNNYQKSLSQFDVIINCAHAENLITVKDVLNYKKLSYTYFIDLSVTCGIDKSVETAIGNIHYNLDDLKDISDRSLEDRKEAIPFVESIIKEEIEALDLWHQTTSFNPILTKVKNVLDEIRKKTIQSQLKSLDDTHLKLAEEITLKFMNELIKLPAIDLQQRCLRGENTDERIKLLSELFNVPEKILPKLKN